MTNNIPHCLPDAHYHNVVFDHWEIYCP